MPLKQRRQLVDGADTQLPISRQCRLLKLHRSSYYYKHKGISAEYNTPQPYTVVIRLGSIIQIER